MFVLNPDVNRLNRTISQWDRQRKMLDLATEGRSLKSIGDSFGISGSRVGDIVRKSLRLLRVRKQFNQAYQPSYLDDIKNARDNKDKVMHACDEFLDHLIQLRDHYSIEKGE
jgi:hypothetical protein